MSLLGAGASAGEPAELLAVAETDDDGAFEISYDVVLATDRVLYLIVGPHDAEPRPIALVSVLGSGPLPESVVVNDRTTVASAFALAQFAAGLELSGTSPGIGNAAGMARNLVDVATGDIAVTLADAPNGSETSTLATFNSLANMVAACVQTPIECEAFLDLAGPPGAPRPSDVFAALVDIARNPGNHAAELFEFSSRPPATYVPARELPPSAWTLALRFDGDGSSMSGPGDFAIDHDGNLWVTNNYEFNADPMVPVCGSDLLLEFTPTGRYVGGSPFSGGGLSGAGFGIDIDRYGDVWVGNFGFAAPEPGCPADRQPAHDSVSRFTADGRPLSPDATASSTGGYTQGGISYPQGTVADTDEIGRAHV